MLHCILGGSRRDKSEVPRLSLLPYKGHLSASSFPYTTSNPSGQEGTESSEAQCPEKAWNKLESVTSA